MNFLAVSSELQLSSTDSPGRFFDFPGRITVGNAFDVAVEVVCTSTDILDGPASRGSWFFAENDTAVDGGGLLAFGTSQNDEGVLRIYPANILSQSGTRFQCRDEENNQTLNVTLELRKYNYTFDLLHA